MRMVDLRDRLRFALKPQSELRGLREPGWNDLNGHAAIEQRVRRFQTSPIPPAPTRETTSDGPRRVPTETIVCEIGADYPSGEVTCARIRRKHPLLADRAHSQNTLNDVHAAPA